MPDRLDKCYYWHIYILARMKSNLRELRRGKLKCQTKKKEV